MGKESKGLPVELRAVVKWSVALLGEVIKRELGAKAFARIERVRREMSALRGLSTDASIEVLRRNLKTYQGLSRAERFYVTHAFALMLETINACENAYRTHRLRMSARVSLEPSERRIEALIYVLTAHPTEARSPANIAIFAEIQKVLLRTLETSTGKHDEQLRHLLEVAWRLLTARGRKPTVKDEAEHLYSVLLREDILTELLEASVDLAPVFVRSWVGGDKDGHPGVDERALRASLAISRTRLLHFARRRLSETRSMLKLLPALKHSRLWIKLRSCERALGGLSALRARDASRVAVFRNAVSDLTKTYENDLGALHPALRQLERLIYCFPGLVVPLELREASDVLMSADPNAAIVRMVRELGRLSQGGNPRWYARGLIVSMASEVAHMRAAAGIVRDVFGDVAIPVIPLFEQEAALKAAPKVVAAMLKERQFLVAVKKFWSGYFEVMLGYSDSAKEAGVLPSRIAIADAMKRLDRLISKRGVRPIFFHGSGGSVDRGGGPIEEQTAWWPASALRVYKATLQGEMIERSFASPEITRRRLEQIALRASRGASGFSGSSKTVRGFSERVSALYRAKVASPDFLRVIEKATPYPYLSVLRIGSRPSKRAVNFSVASLRAIPWVLCWTQTRVLFPTWWGIGTAWHELSGEGRKRLARDFKRDALFRSYVKVLAFTLAKVELAVWRLYLENGGFTQPEVARIAAEFEREYRDAIAFVRAVSGKRDLLWYRPWLGESIRLRSPMIHPLNLLQIIALKERDPVIIRETVTGVSIGMLTTG